MTAVDIFRHGISVSLLCALLGLAWMLRTYGHDTTKSLSSHAAQQRYSYIVFLASLVLSACAFYLFSYYWLVPHFSLSGSFLIVALIAIGLIVVTAIVPDAGGKKSLIHGLAAWSMAVSLLVLLVLLAFSGALSGTARLIVWLVVAYMLIDWGLFLFVEKTRNYFLIFQGTYVLSFFVALLGVAYL